MNFLEIIKNSINNLCAKYIERNLSDEMLPIFYVAGSQTLPAPLEQKEEEEMIKNRVGSLLEEKQFETVEQAKDQMNHLCNDKIMAMDEFSRQILSKIDANHQEVVFMYNLLGEKENEFRHFLQ